MRGISLLMGADVAEEIWRELRNDGSPFAKAVAISEISVLVRVGLVSAQDARVRIAALDTCPGHDDEGGRDWCAYGCMTEAPPHG